MSQVTFWPICDHNGCVRREPTDFADLLSPRRAYDAVTPADATVTFLPRGERVWVFACERHHGDTAGAVMVFELRKVRAHVEESRVPPPRFRETNWVGVHRLITQGVSGTPVYASLSGPRVVDGPVERLAPYVPQAPVQDVGVYVGVDEDVPVPDEAPPEPDWLV